jgi:hypothetical protein
VRELRKLVRGCEVCLREIRQSLGSVGVFAVTVRGKLGRKWHRSQKFCLGYAS